jgi:hypothetical protein
MLRDRLGQITQHIQGVLDNMQGHYIVVVETSESDGEAASLLAIHNERKLCFLMLFSHMDIEDAKAVCAQAVLYNSTPDDCLLYYAVYDFPTRMAHFCLCDPRGETFEDVAKHSMRSHAGQVATLLRIHISSNVRVLQ